MSHNVSLLYLGLILFNVLLATKATTGANFQLKKQRLVFLWHSLECATKYYLVSTVLRVKCRSMPAQIYTSMNIQCIISRPRQSGCNGRSIRGLAITEKGSEVRIFR